MIVDPALPPVNKTDTVDSGSEEDVVILNPEDISKPICR